MDNKVEAQKVSLIKNLFSFFKISQSKRENAEKPKDVRTWIIHGISELIGTILLSLLLAGLSTTVGQLNNKAVVIEEYLLHPIIVGFYASFIAVGLVLFIFLRFSCDLNPSVSLFRYLNGTNNGWYTSYKISIQFLGGFIAGLIIYGVGSSTAPEGFLYNQPITTIGAAKKAFHLFQGSSSVSTMSTAGTFWILFVELVMTAVLLFPIFSPNINNKYRDLFIMFIISMSVWMGILGGSAAINPARGFAQQVSTLFIQNLDTANISVNSLVAANGMTIAQQKDAVMNSVISATITMILADLLAPVFYIFIQGLTKYVVNPFVVKVIAYKNYKSQNMEKPSSK
ncbi:aquaporin [Mycoplasma sp. CSL10137]|uniref:aquaporin n=1 Tax=Mycoplasma sp. CSL10137 TaxID=2813824 RepID=UPI00197C2A6D|nr:aquaporin [Mycoplasma sp. CSL10137]MBN4083428.1 aquaporin [Mycoplasma sp. CSL10137]